MQPNELPTFFPQVPVEHVEIPRCCSANVWRVAIKIGLFIKNLGQGQKASFTSALEGATQVNCFYKQSFCLPTTSPQGQTLDRRLFTAPSRLEGVRAYNTACVTTILVHLHTTSFLWKVLYHQSLTVVKLFRKIHS